VEYRDKYLRADTVLTHSLDSILAGSLNMKRRILSNEKTNYGSKKKMAPLEILGK